MIREPNDVSFLARRDGGAVVMRLNKENYRMNPREALRLADELVDAAETKETPND